VLNIRYIIISPVRDEADYIEFTLESVIRQTVRPILWIIVKERFWIDMRVNTLG